MSTIPIPIPMTLSAAMLVATMLPGAAHALVGPGEPFDARRIPIELQAWWLPNFGHIHAGTRLPLGQQVSGVIEFDVRIVLHNNPGRLVALDFDDDDGGVLRIELDLDCPYDGTTHTNCAFNVPVSLDTRVMADGWRELRIRAETETPDEKRFLNSSGIPLRVVNGGPQDDYDRFCENRSLIGRGWYEDMGYTNAIIECIPLTPISGVHTFWVRAQKDSQHLTVALDKTHHVPAVGPWPAQPHSGGSILFDADGDFQDWIPIEIDTTDLADGWHALAVTSRGTDSDTSECAFCDGEPNHTSGTAKVWFSVDNGAGADPPGGGVPACTADADCDDGAFCNGSETCSSAGACQPGEAPSCNDGLGCTVDACDEQADRCSHAANDAHCDNGRYCDGAERCDVDRGCRPAPHRCDETPCSEDAGRCTEADEAVLEGVNLNAGADHVTVPLRGRYRSPVVVCSANYTNNAVPVVARVSNVGAGSFDLRLQSPSGAPVEQEEVSCIVVEEGAWIIDGVALEAVAYTSTRTDRRGRWVGEVREYGNEYVDPVVLGQVMTENDPRWSVFWARGEDYQSPPSSTFLATGKMVGEDADTLRDDETVGYVVVESGRGTLGGVAYEAAVGANIVRTPAHDAVFEYAFSAPFDREPIVVIATQAGMNGGDGAWAQSDGLPAAGTDALHVSVDEDLVGDDERFHKAEQVGYLVFETVPRVPLPAAGAD